MTAPQAEPADQPQARITVPAELALTDAAALREGALATLEQAKDGLELDLAGDGDPSICALQMLIAIRRSAESRGLTFRPSARTSAVLDGIDLN